MMTAIKLAAGSALLAFAMSAAPAFAVGDSDGTSSPTTENCKEGEVWNKKTKKCEQARSGIDQDSLYEAGRDLALAGRYDEAITVLSLVGDKSDPRVLNYLGYAHRKQGRMRVGLGYYEEALRIDPDYTLVREYLGEAHVQMGNIPAARDQLAEIEKRCGRSCEEYVDLAAVIDNASVKN